MASIDTAGELMALVRSRYPLIGVESIEGTRFDEMLNGVAQQLSMPLFEWSPAMGLRKKGANGPIYDTNKIQTALQNVEQLKEPTIFAFRDLQDYLDDPGVLLLLKELAQSCQEKRSSIIFCSTCVDVPETLERDTAKIALSLPTRQELSEFAHLAVKELAEEHKIRVAISDEDFEEIISNLVGMTLFEAERALARAVLDDHALTKDDLERIWEVKKELIDKYAAVEFAVPRHDMTEVGGHLALKSWLSKRSGTMSPEAKAFGLEAPKGMFLVGVQGCGKSMSARAVAREMRLPLLVLDIARLFDKNIGETEKNLENALAVTERVSPCVLMIDEIEKMLAPRGGRGVKADGAGSTGSDGGHNRRADDDGGLSSRMLDKLLAWLAGRPEGVFVVATSNNLASIPAELTRKGLFDEVFFVDLPSLAERGEILRLQVEKRGRNSEDFDIDRIAAACEGFSGAEIEQVVVSAMYSAFHDKGELDTAHLLHEVESTYPLSNTKAEEIEALRSWAEGRTVRAN